MQIKLTPIFKKGEKVVAGISGGVDSTVLLDLLKKSDLNLDIIVAHLNHGYIKEGDGYELFVHNLAKKYSLPFYSKRVKLKGAGVEERGREERYKFFNEVLEEAGADSIVTAHNKNEQAETILLNLIRGAGLDGLSGIQKVTGNLKRPLLDVPKEDLINYAKVNKLEWIEDVANKDISFSRNRIRLNVLPELEKINPKTIENVSRTAGIITEVKSYLDAQIKDLIKTEEKRAIIDLKKTSLLPKFLQKEIFKKAILYLKPLNLESVHIENILKLLGTTGSKEIDLGSGLKAAKIYDTLFIGFAGERESDLKPKTLKNKAKWDDFSFTLSKPKTIGKETPDSVFVDAKKIKNLKIRAWQEGDYLYLKKDGGRKKLSDLFIDLKVPKKERKIYPIIVNEANEVVWVPLLKLNGKFRTVSTGKDIINIKVKYEK